VKRPAKERAPAPRIADAPLHELERDPLSVFLYLALLPEETKVIVRDLGLTVPGFRASALGDVERCDVIADEIRARPEAAGPVLDALRAAFGSPPLDRHPLDPRSAEELLRLAGHEAGLPLAAWRVLSDRSGAVRAAATPVLEELARHYFGPAEGSAEGGEAPARGEREGEEGEDPGARAGRLERELARARERLQQAEAAAGARAEDQRRRAEEQREKLQASLREARARESQLAGEAARAREDAEAARRELGTTRAELEAVRASDAVVEAQRARAEARDLESRAAALDARLERARARERELERDLEAAQRGRAAGAAAPPAAPASSGGADEDGGAEADLASWLLPVYTREFYDSLARWDRRIQRAAFKQAHLLAADHRHPSLRALPLEGLPGYYRVRVATDVRLIYRRGDRQNEVEILSLIDREDLDRYIRQAKTRG